MTFLSRWVPAILLISTTALGAENGDPAIPKRMTLDIAPTTGMLIQHRAGANGGASLGWSFGGQVRGYRGMHGLVLGYTGLATEMNTAGFDHGPSTHAVDLGYSVRLADSARGGPVGVALVLDVGPSIAFVERTLHGDAFGNNVMVDVPGHATFGGRMSFAVVLRIQRVFVGLDIGYRGGHPLDVARAGWEGGLFTQASVGVELGSPTTPTR